MMMIIVILMMMTKILDDVRSTVVYNDTVQLTKMMLVTVASIQSHSFITIIFLL